MDPLNDSLFAHPAAESAAAFVAALAPAVAPGHFDELRGAAAAASQDAPSPPGTAPLAAPWDAFFSHLGSAGFADLPRRAVSLERQIRDNGVTYNVYADSHGPQRPWALDLFPLIVSPESWARIERGVLQRARLLDRVMADVYGPQQLLAQGLLPAALVRGHPGYLRGMHGVRPPGDTWLRIAAFDLARGPDGHWWVVSQRTQAPSGLGYLLENRLAIARQFPQAFKGLHVQRLAATYGALMQGLQQMCPAGAPPHIALLTPGPYNETYFEHAYLARYLGLTLVEGSDLTVRDERLYLKTLQGLRPVHGLIKRVDDAFLDPLELRPDSTLGVPGLMQAVRAGHVLMANTPGSAFLESPALLGFLPGVARALLGEELALPALPTWWCGEHAALQAALPQLADSTIKPTYPGSPVHPNFDAALGTQMDPRALDEWAERIRRQPDAHTVQGYLPLSQMPTWTAGRDGSGRIAPRGLMLRVFALNDGPQSWRVLPGGLARLAGPNAQIASMQRGGSSADVWVQTLGEVDRSTRIAPQATPASLERHRAPVTSRAAENMFWLGRYTERAENTLRLARLVLDSLGGEEHASPALVGWLYRLAERNALVPDTLTPPEAGDEPAAPTTPEAPIHPALPWRRAFEQALIAELGDAQEGRSVGFNLRCLRQAAAAVRERLSQENWNHIVRAESDFLRRTAEQAGEGRAQRFAAGPTQRTLEAASALLAAITGAQSDRMTRDDAWQLLSIGRLIERLHFLSGALADAFAHGVLHEASGFEAVVALFDSTITFHARYQQRRDVAPLVDLLVIDHENPRALAWIADTLRARMAQLAGTAPGALTALSHELPDPATWTLEALCQADADGHHAPLQALLEQCQAAAFHISDAIAMRYFTLTVETLRPVGI